MELDQLLDLFHIVSNKLLPIFSVIALGFLIVFIKRLIVLLKKMEQTVDTTHQMIHKIDHQVEMLDKPLHTIHHLSDTVDQVHEASKKTLRSLFVVILDNFQDIFHTMKQSTAVKDKQQKGVDHDEFKQ